jgi:hypothetical protein
MKKIIILVTLFSFIFCGNILAQEKEGISYKKRRGYLLKKEILITVDTTFKERKDIKKTKTPIVTDEPTTNSKITPSKKHKIKVRVPKTKSAPKVVRVSRKRHDPAPCHAFSKNKWMTDKYAHKKSKYLK